MTASTALVMEPYEARSIQLEDFDKSCVTHVRSVLTINKDVQIKWSFYRIYLEVIYDL